MNTATDFVTMMNAAYTAAEAGKADHQKHVFTVEQGRKYARIVCTNGPQRSAFCFIDAEGNIFKADSWTARANGIRSNVAKITPDFCAKLAATGYACGSWLYR